jgi:hypothetical protein
MAPLSEIFKSRVAAWKQLHLNQWFVKMSHKRSFKSSLTEGWRKLQNSELHNLYSSDIIRMINQGGRDLRGM